MQEGKNPPLLAFSTLKAAPEGDGPRRPRPYTCAVSTAVGYSGLFGLTGYRYIVVAFIARLPLAMSQLGTLLLVATTTKSYTQAGICAGALAVCNAVGAPWFGSLTDRHGQSRVLMFQCVAGTIGLFATVATRYFDLHHTPDDTLDKIDKAQLRQNVAAWTAMLAVLAGPLEPPARGRRR